jgi:hypothetical protein
LEGVAQRLFLCAPLRRGQRRHETGQFLLEHQREEVAADRALASEAVLHARDPKPSLSFGRSRPISWLGLLADERARLSGQAAAMTTHDGALPLVVGQALEETGQGLPTLPFAGR